MSNTPLDIRLAAGDSFQVNPRTSLTYAKFVERVRRFRASDVLRALARIPASSFEPGEFTDDTRTVNSWTVAAVAQVAIQRGNEYREAHELTPAELRMLLLAFTNSYDPEPLDPDLKFLATLVRLWNEQFDAQESIWEELARAVHLFGMDTTADHRFVRECVETSLGMSVVDAISAGVVAFAATGKSGVWQPELLDTPELAELFEIVNHDTVIAFAESMTLDLREHVRRRKVSPAIDPLERWGVPVIRTHPLVRLPDGLTVVPQQWMLMRRLSPAALYYDGIDHGDQAFGSALGRVVEAYVGKLLESVAGAKVLPKIVWQGGTRSDVESCDWFCVLPDVVLLVEAKSARLKLVERHVPDKIVSGRVRVLAEAMTQLNKSTAQIDGWNPAFSQIPLDRPRIALAVTSDPYRFANAPIVREHLPAQDQPTLFVSLRELEMLTVLDANALGRELLRIVHDPEQREWDVGVAMQVDIAERTHPVLDSVHDLIPVFTWATESVSLVETSGPECCVQA